ncbi:OmpA family protein [Jiella avicenniae]|uniref:OmpA family protein n=1 Tax=Jiella avicenniae TaxID=2907202 RepID=A0A9X1TDJ9_9HYPH|nr:OmpA family protein [Jiella avicenniae]MCE7030208.1 OmpA family protein [Jiella avicenniae]
MRSTVSTTALLTAALAMGTALVPQTASADGYYGPRTSAGEINRVINGASGYGRGQTGYAHRSHGGYSGYGRYDGYGGYSGSVSGGYGHAYHHVGHRYDRDGYGYGYADRGYGHDVSDLDDFTVHSHRAGRLVYRYQTVSPFAPEIDYAEPAEPTDGMQAELAGPEPRSDVGRPILFASGSQQLSETAAADLDRIGNILLAYAETDVRILLTAYTDATGTREQNEAISMRRIAVVKAYLADKFDIPEDRFVEAPFGETPAPGIEDPLAGENRQVVVALLGLDLDPTSDGALADAGETTSTPAASYRSAESPEPTCSVPAYPHADYKVEGRLVAVGFQDLDDFGGGRVVQVCKVGH